MRRLRAIKGTKKTRPRRPVCSSKKSPLAKRGSVKVKKTVAKESPDRLAERNFREHQYWIVKKREYWRRQFMNLKLH